MKSLIKHIKEKLIVNKDYKEQDIENLVDNTLKNNTSIVKDTPKKYVAFLTVDNFIKCLDELNINYKEIENNDPKDNDAIWFEFKKTFYSPLTHDEYKYVKIYKPVQKYDCININFLNTKKTLYIMCQGVIDVANVVTGISNSGYERLKDAFIQLVKNNYK